jgi:acyl-CoA thioester hydrolase
MLHYETQIRVQYYDTDSMGVVHHANYIRYFETGRTEMMRALGVSYAEMEATGVMMPVISTDCRYFVPARYDELLTIQVRIRERIAARVRFEYEILNSTGQTICTGSTVLAFMDRASRRPCRPPAMITQLNENL